MAPELGTMSEGDTGLSGCAMAAMAGRAADGRTARLHGDLHMFVMTFISQEMPPCVSLRGRTYMNQQA